jgi:UDP-N-acetylmuramate dehydrogenase
MLSIKYNVPLLPYNTFGMDVYADALSVLHTAEACKMIQASKPADKSILPLGGGSNMLFTQDVPFWVLKNEIKGIEVIQEDAASVWLSVGAGVVWHDFVLYCVDNDYAGVENLSLIPGTVGAAPIQNIGAYGTEVKQVIDSVTYWDLEHQTFVTLSNTACQFGYRESIFKKDLKGKFIITNVAFKLSKTPHYNISYGNIQEEITRQEC